MSKEILFGLLIMSSVTATALTHSEEDRIAQCAMKGVEFGLIWEHRNEGADQVVIASMVDKLIEDGAPPRIIDIWSQQAMYAMSYEDRYLMLNDIVFECIEVGY